MSSVPPVPFDPYHKWLGIPRRDQPPNHYRLLGIPLFEDDVQVIEAASDRQMAFLRKFQAGEHSAAALKLLNEVSRARICLLKSDAKLAYDTTLRAGLSETDPNESGAVSMPAEVVTRPPWASPIYLGGGAAALVIAGIVIYALRPSPAPVAVAPPQVAAQAVDKAAKPEVRPAENAEPVKADAAVEVAKSDAVPAVDPRFFGARTPKSNPRRSSNQQNRPPAPDDNPSGNSSPDSPGTSPFFKPNVTPPGKTADRSTAMAKENSTGKPAGTSGEPASDVSIAQFDEAGSGAIDLLSRIDVQRDSVSGEWQLENKQLTGKSMIGPTVARLGLPYRPAQQYDLLAIIERQADQGTFAIGLPVQGSQVCVVLDTGGNYDVSGLSQIKGRAANRNPTSHRSKVLPGGESIPVVCSVRRKSITVRANGNVIIDWKGDVDQLTAPDAMPLVDPQSLMLGIQGGEFLVSALKYRPVTGTGSSSSDMPATAVGASAPIAGVLTTSKLATPDAAALAAAQQEIHELFKSEYALARKADGKNQEPKTSLARTLMARAQSTDDNPAACYVMLSEAAELAAEAGQLSLAWDILVELGDRFNMQSLALMERAIKAATPFAKSLEEIAFLGSMYVLLLDEAVQVNDFETAGKAAQSAATATRKLTSLKEQLALRVRRINQLRDAYEAAKSAQLVLQTNPEDGPANLDWGRYLCFYQANWATGLPLLAKCSDATVAEVARRDLDQPRDMEALDRLGDDWWELAEKEKEPVKTTIRERAIEAWQMALPYTKALQKQTLEKKISRIFQQTRFFETSGSGNGVTVAGPEYNPGNFFTVEFWVFTNSDTGILISKRDQRNDSSLIVTLDRGRPSIAGRSNNGSKIARSKITINDGRWHHIAAVKVGTKLGLFVDGKWAAQTEFLDTYLSRSPWKLGHDSQWEMEEPHAKFCRLRFSKEARYLVNFTPERIYGRDKATTYIP